MGRQLTLSVVGAIHPNKDGGNRKSEILFCSPGEFIELRPDPKNEFDPQAVAVFSARGFQIGYLTAERAPWIGGMLRNGPLVDAVFQEATDWGAYIRIGIDGEKPTLPPPSPKPAQQPPRTIRSADGWWPDEMPPDDHTF